MFATVKRTSLFYKIVFDLHKHFLPSLVFEGKAGLHHTQTLDEGKNV